MEINFDKIDVNIRTAISESLLTARDAGLKFSTRNEFLDRISMDVGNAFEDAFVDKGVFTFDMSMCEEFMRKHAFHLLQFTSAARKSGLGEFNALDPHAFMHEFFEVVAWTWADMFIDNSEILGSFIVATGSFEMSHVNEYVFQAELDSTEPLAEKAFMYIIETQKYPVDDEINEE